jgi:D-beta-D-heptose 7-phosphate kinase/D-beta-D-heptose 1-phosphate adenosyltransferase
MNERTLREVAAEFSTRRILVVGDLMLDEYIWGEVRRISPEAPVPVVEVDRRTYTPGGASNTAANVVALGGRPFLCGVVGNDYQAARLREALVRTGVDIGGVLIDRNRATTTKSRIVAHNQQVVRLDCEQRFPLSPPLEHELLQKIEARLSQVDGCIISDYAKGVVSESLARQVIRLARQAGKPTIVDPKGTDYRKYRGATLVKPNSHEAERCVKQEITTDASLVEVGQRLLDILEDSAVLITRGAEGMSLFRQDAQAVHIPALARNVFDVTGAGDTVACTMALALATGRTLEQGMLLANHAASIVVGKVGTATVTLDELLAAIQTEDGTCLRRSPSPLQHAS